MLQHTCCKRQTQKARKMKTFTLNNGQEISTMNECAAQFFKAHETHETAKQDLDAIKKAIKENDALAWFKYGVSLTVKTTERFNKEKAISLLSALGATDQQIADCYVAISSKAVSKAK